MRAFAIDRPRTPGSIHDLPVPKSEAHDVLVHVVVAGVNPVDWKIRDNAAVISCRAAPAREDGGRRVITGDEVIAGCSFLGGGIRPSHEQSRA